MLKRCVAGLFALVAVQPVAAGELGPITLEAGATGTRAELTLDAATPYRVLSLAGPDRLVVDLPATRLKPGWRPPAATGIVRAVRTGQPEPGVIRIVFDLASPVLALTPQMTPAGAGARLVLEWPGDGSEPAMAAAPTPAIPAASLPPWSATTAAPEVPERSAPEPDVSREGHDATTARVIAPVPLPPALMPAAAPQPAASGVIATGVPVRIATGVPMPPRSAPEPAREATATPIATFPDAVDRAPVKTMQDIARRGGLRALVIAIDAGHGGQDPGARGANGSREKDLTLAVARELARQVNATPGLRAYLTRDVDVFIPLVQRYQKARAAKADLFVSIHADAFTNPAASGSSVFVLSQRGASSQAARWLATQENAADLVGGVRLNDKDDTLASVLLDLSQSATMRASEEMAGHVLTGLKRLGKTHKSHVEQANFVVLRAPDVPSMLVETAFITNPEEERKLNDPQHRALLARAILDGVNTYFLRQPPPGTLYSARAMAEVPATAAVGTLR